MELFYSPLACSLASHITIREADIAADFTAVGLFDKKIATAEWGDGVVNELAADLAKRYLGGRGYTRPNLFRMRQFYEAYRSNRKVSPLVRQLPWTHHLIILGQAKPIEVREFYILAAIKELCQTSLVLSNGKLVYRGSVNEGLAHYSETVATAATEEDLRGTRWRYVRLMKQTSNSPASLSNDEPFALECALELQHLITRGYLFAIANDAVGNQILHQRIELQQLERVVLTAGIHQIQIKFPALWLAPGLYTFHLKFTGYNGAGIEERQVSERLLVEMRGQEEGISRSLLTPRSQWQVIDSTP